MRILNKFWPWSTIAALREELDYNEDEIADLDELTFDLREVIRCLANERNRHQSLGVDLARDLGIAWIAIDDIKTMIAAIKKPNGSTKKIERILDLAIADFGMGYSEKNLVVARECYAKEQEARAERAAAEGSGSPDEGAN